MTTGFNRRIQTTPLEASTDKGLAGALAWPDSNPQAFTWYAEVPANQRNPRPGDAVYVNSSGGLSAVTSDTLTDMVGVVSQRMGETPRELGSTGDTGVEYRDGEFMQIWTAGVIWLRVVTGAGETIPYNTELVFEPSSTVTNQFNWQPRPATDITVPSSPDADNLASYLRNRMKHIKVVSQNRTTIAASTSEALVEARIYPV